MRASWKHLAADRGKLPGVFLGRRGDFGAPARSEARHEFSDSTHFVDRRGETGRRASRSAMDLVAGGRRASQARFSGRHMLFPPQL